MKIGPTVFWNVTQCSSVDTYQLYSKTFISKYQITRPRNTGDNNLYSLELNTLKYRKKIIFIAQYYASCRFMFPKIYLCLEMSRLIRYR
jgi:hypothetical protein